MEQKVEAVISGRGNCMCQGPGAGQAMASEGRRKQASVAGKVRWVVGTGVEVEWEWKVHPAFGSSSARAWQAELTEELLLIEGEKELVV